MPLPPKTKRADLQTKSAANQQAAPGCQLQQEIAHRCKYTIAFHCNASNTDLLTSDRERKLLRPRPAFSQLAAAMADFRPGGQKDRFGVASRAQHRFVSATRAFFLCLSCPGKRALRNRRVLRYFTIFTFPERNHPWEPRMRRSASSRPLTQFMIHHPCGNCKHYFQI